MSAIVSLAGTYAERREIRKQVGSGLHWFCTINNTSFYARKKPDFPITTKESDVICVDGKRRSVRFTPEELEDRDFYGEKYSSPDHLIVLEGNDTLLYHLQDFVPRTHAELALVRTYLTFVAMGILGAAALVGSWMAGSGWWSIVAGVGAAFAVAVYVVVLSYPLWAAIGALRGAAYIWWQVLVRQKSRSGYRELVGQLSESGEPYLRLPHAILRHLI